MTHLYLLPRPILFAHRGASASAPENTLAAFRLAVRQGAPAIELDVKLSADGQVMVFHDPTVNRTTDGTGFVHRLPLAELRELDAGGKFDPRFRGEGIPTLTEVFEEVGHDIFINVELTNYVTPLDSLVDMTTQIVRYMGMENQVLFSSFLANNLFRARKFLPEVPAAILFGEGISRHGEIIDMGVNARIIEKSGAWYAYNGEKIGQGRDNAREFLRENEALAHEIENKVRESLGIPLLPDAASNA